MDKPTTTTIAIMILTGCPKKNDTSVTKWHKIIYTECLSIFGVDSYKLNATRVPLNKTRAKRVVKNLTARLALVFIPSIIE